MGSFQSKASGPQIHSPRHNAIAGRMATIDSPRIGRTSLGLRSHGSHGRLSSKNLKSPVIGEKTPLVIKSTPQPVSPTRMLGEGDSLPSPPLSVWIGPALCCALAYALYNIFIKKGSASINPILGGVILQFVAAVLGCVLLGCVVYYNSLQNELLGEDDSSSMDNTLEWDWVGVKWAVLAGVSVGAAEIISFCVSGMGVQAMQSIPIIIGGSVMFGTVLGYLALGETLTTRGWGGVLMISMGIALVGMDDQGEGV